VLTATPPGSNNVVSSAKGREEQRIFARLNSNEKAYSMKRMSIINIGQGSVVSTAPALANLHRASTRTAAASPVRSTKTTSLDSHHALEEGGPNDYRTAMLPVKKLFSEGFESYAFANVIEEDDAHAQNSLDLSSYSFFDETSTGEGPTRSVSSLPVPGAQLHDQTFGSSASTSSFGLGYDGFADGPSGSSASINPRMSVTPAQGQRTSEA
jgi:hypothetical protein